MGVSTTDRTGAAMDDVSDAELMADSTAHADSFGLLFDRHVDAIYGYVVRRVGLSLAEELTAETFARAFAERARFIPLHESAGPWLYGIATNVIRKARRAERRQLAAYAKAGGIERETFDDVERADARIVAAREAPRLIRELILLEPGDRDALLLFVWQELTYEEIGTALGIPTGTVASRINRAGAGFGPHLERQATNRQEW